jgi:hypothetical protein
MTRRVAKVAKVQQVPLCVECGEQCDCGNRPHEKKCGACSICWEMHLREVCSSLRRKNDTTTKARHCD